MVVDTGTPAATPAQRSGAGKLLVPVAVGGAVSLTLGVYGRLHHPTGIAVNLAGFSSALTVKVWLASVAVLLALVQLTSALIMYGKLPGVGAVSWIGGLHRWSGRLAFLTTVPVAMQCLYALGFQTTDARVLLHSAMGCLFFGAFTVKMLALPKRGLPGWTLPVLGGLVFTLLVAIWLSSSLWYFTTFGVHR
jgi:uncharacterized protein DUF6529